MSRTGIALCCIYLLLTIASVLWGLSVDDSKGRFVLLQAPIVLQLAGLSAMGLRPLLSGMSWVVAYAVLVPLTLGVLYLLGKALGRLVSSGNAEPER